jgi:hypothetical protein
MSRNTKLRLQVHRRELAARNHAEVFARPTPTPPATSWWTTASRNGFTSRAAAETRREQTARATES